MTDHYPEYDLARGQRLADHTPAPTAVAHDAPHVPPPPVVHASNHRGGLACRRPHTTDDIIRATSNPADVSCPDCAARLASPSGEPFTMLDGRYVEHASRQVQTAHGLVSLVLTAYWPNPGMAPARGAQQILDDLDTTQWSHK